MSEQRMRRSDVLIRRLVADDWEQAREARLAGLAEAPYAFASTLAREQALDEEVWRGRAGSGRTVAAFDGPVIVGLATGISTDDLSPDYPSGDDQPVSDQPGQRLPEWNLVGMWVAPEYRGHGVADSLVAEVCDLGRQAGAQSVALWVTELNDRARAFYRRLGFVPSGARMLVRPDEPDFWEVELTLALG
jgi:ribosomal protein S18 acetylase RimI-like enzyme